MVTSLILRLKRAAIVLGVIGGVGRSSVEISDGAVSVLNAAVGSGCVDSAAGCFLLEPMISSILTIFLNRFLDCSSSLMMRKLIKPHVFFVRSPEGVG